MLTNRSESPMNTTKDLFPEDTPNFFADAESTYHAAQFVITGVPYEGTVSFRKGTKYAPRDIRRASWNFETFNLLTHVDFSCCHVHDYGDLVFDDTVTSKQVFEQLKSQASQLYADKKTMVFLGGEHSITAGIVHGLPTSIKIIGFDAHLDFRDGYMDNPYSHASTIRRITDHVSVDNLRLYGIRSAEHEELKQAQSLGLTFVEARAFQQKPVDDFIKEIKMFMGEDPVYLTLDIDVIDPAFAPGTGTPEPFGLTPVQLLPLLKTIAPNIIGFDIVEVCPSCDHGQTAILAAKYVRMLIEWVHQYSLFGD